MNSENMILDKLSQIESLLLNNKEVLSFNEACQFLGYSSSHLYKLTSKGEIPHYKPEGKKIYFNRQEILEWLQRNRVKPSYEIEKEAANHIVKNKIS